MSIHSAQTETHKNMDPALIALVFIPQVPLRYALQKKSSSVVSTLVDGMWVLAFQRARVCSQGCLLIRDA